MTFVILTNVATVAELAERRFCNLTATHATGSKTLVRRCIFSAIFSSRRRFFDAMDLPEPSQRLTVIERRVGYERQVEEYGGDWSIAHFIKATEENDEAERQAIMDEILNYNREDLEPT